MIPKSLFGGKSCLRGDHKIVVTYLGSWGIDSFEILVIRIPDFDRRFIYLRLPPEIPSIQFQ